MKKQTSTLNLWNHSLRIGLVSAVVGAALWATAPQAQAQVGVTLRGPQEAANCGTITVTNRIVNNGATLSGLMVTNTLPSSSYAYVPGLTTITLPGGVVLTNGAAELYVTDTQTNQVWDFSSVVTPSTLTNLVISEVYYNAIEVPETENEWFEIYNPTTNAVTMNGWSVRDSAPGAVDDLPPITIAAGEFVIIAASTNAFLAANSPYTDRVFEVADGRIGSGLNNFGDGVLLLDAASNVVDAVSYGASTAAFSPSVPTVAAGHSLARDPADNDTNTRSDWEDQDPPDPGEGLLPVGIQNGASITIVYAVEIDCGAVGGQLFSRAGYEQPPGTPGDSLGSMFLTLNEPDLTVTKTPIMQQKGVGDTVTWTVQIENAGFGAAPNVVAMDSLGPGLVFTGFSIAPTNVTWGSNVVWDSTVIPAFTNLAAQSNVNIVVTAQVVSCSGLYNLADAEWGCSGLVVLTNQACEDTSLTNETATAGIRFVDRYPSLSFSVDPSPLLVNYCGGSDMTLYISNAIGPNIGIATNLQFTPDLPSGWSLTGGSVDSNGVIQLEPLAAGASTSVVVTVVAGGACPIDLSDQDIILVPSYTDLCGNLFSGPLVAEVASVVNVPVASITKIVPSDVSSSEGSFPVQIELTYTDFGGSESITVTDVFPAHSNLTVGNITLGGVEVGNTIEWTIVPGVGSGVVTATFDMVFGELCDGPDGLLFNEVQADDFDDCRGCTRSVSGSGNLFPIRFTPSASCSGRPCDYPDLSFGLSLDPNPLFVEYCAIGSITHSITLFITNAAGTNIGDASDLAFTPALPAGWLVSGTPVDANGLIQVGLVTNGASTSVTFAVESGGDCPLPTGTLPLSFVPEYIDECGDSYSGPAVLTTATVAGPPSASITKIMPTSVNADAGSFPVQIELTYTDFTGTESITVTDLYPVHTNLTVTNIFGGGVQSGNTVVWSNIVPGAGSGVVTSSFTMLIGDPCGGPGASQYNEVQATDFTDCQGCLQPVYGSGDQFPIQIIPGAACAPPACEYPELSFALDPTLLAVDYCAMGSTTSSVTLFITNAAGTNIGDASDLAFTPTLPAGWLVSGASVDSNGLIQVVGLVTNGASTSVTFAVESGGSCPLPTNTLYLSFLPEYIDECGNLNYATTLVLPVIVDSPPSASITKIMPTNVDADDGFFPVRIELTYTNFTGGESITVTDLFPVHSNLTVGSISTGGVEVGNTVVWSNIMPGAGSGVVTSSFNMLIGDPCGGPDARQTNQVQATDFTDCQGCTRSVSGSGELFPIRIIPGATCGPPPCDSTDLSFALSQVPDPLVLDYCASGSTTHSITLYITNTSGANLGDAYGLAFTPTVPAGWRVSGTPVDANGLIQVGTVTNGASTSVTFAVESGGSCPLPTGTLNLSFLPEYIDECGDSYSGPAVLTTVTVASPPRASITKIMPTSVSGDTNSFPVRIELTYTNFIGGETITVTDLYPSHTNLTVTNISAGGVQSGSTVVWSNIPLAAGSGVVTSSFSMVIGTPCGGPDGLQFNEVQATPFTDCQGCLQPVSGSGNQFPIRITPGAGCLPPFCGYNGAKSVTPLLTGLCEPVVLTHSFSNFLGQTGTWVGVTFSADLASGTVDTTNDVQLLVNGSNVLSFATFTQTSPNLILDLSGLDSSPFPDLSMVTSLEISWPVSVTNEGQHIDTSTLDLPGCSSETDAAVWYAAGSSLMEIGLQKISVVGACERVPGSIDLTMIPSAAGFPGDPIQFPAYDVVVTLDMDFDMDSDSGFSYITNTTTFSNIVDNLTGLPIPPFNPAISNNQLTWNLGDLGTNTYMSIHYELRPSCGADTNGQRRAELSYNTLCDRGTTNNLQTAVSRTNVEPFFVQANLINSLQPEVQFLTATQIVSQIRILNTGDPDAYNLYIEMDLPLGVSFGSAEIEPYLISTTQVVWNLHRTLTNSAIRVASNKYDTEGAVNEGPIACVCVASYGSQNGC